MEKGPYPKIQCLSYAAAITVLYWHAGNWAEFARSETSAAYLFEWEVIRLCMWAVPFFFAVSAYLFFRGFTMDRLLPKWKRRVRTLLLPYLVWNTLYYLYYAVFLRIPLVRKVLLTEPVPLTEQAAAEGVLFHSCLGVMWYVALLMVFVLMAPVFYYALRNKIVGAVCVSALFFLMLVGAPFPFSFAQMSWESLFFYAAGAYIGLCFPALPEKNAAKPLRALAWLGLAALVAFSAARAKPAFYAALFIALLWIGVDGSRIRPRFLYGTSFFLYASHMMLIQVPEKLLQMVLPLSDIGAIVAYLIAPIFTAALVCGIAYWMNRYSPQLYGLLCGGRGLLKKQSATESN